MDVYKSIIVFLFFVRNGCLADKTYFSKWIKTDLDYPWKVYIFETLLGEGLSHCIENCKAKKMCKYINFNVKSDACFLVGVNSIPESLDYSLNDRIETKKGFLLGKKQDWNLKTYNMCSDCEPYGVCKHDKPPAEEFDCQTYGMCKGEEQHEDKYTACQNSGCGPPDNKPFTVVQGNMFSIGDKIKYECREGYTDVSGGAGIVICQSSGIWSSTAIKCEPKTVGTTCSEESCYLLYKSKQTWHDGKIYCESLGGHLADIKTELEYKFIKENIFSTVETYTWLGANDEEVEGTFIWSDGTNVVDGYTYWGKRQPNGGTENCISYLPYRKGKWLHEWHDSKCSRRFWSLCEF